MKVPETTRVTRGEDGVFHWVYALNLFSTPTIFFLVWRIFFFIFLGIFAVVFLSDLQWGVRQILNDLKFLGIFLLGMTAVTGLGYLIYAAMMGGKYVVEFELDERRVTHRQIPAQAKKARAIGTAAAAAGLASGRFGAASAGLAASRTEMTSELAKVRRVKARPKKDLILVNGFLDRNQVYVPREDFDLILNFLLSHCPNAKTKSKEK